MRGQRRPSACATRRRMMTALMQIFSPRPLYDDVGEYGQGPETKKMPRALPVNQKPFQSHLVPSTLQMRNPIVCRAFEDGFCLACDVPVGIGVTGKTPPFLCEIRLVGQSLVNKWPEHAEFVPGVQHGTSTSLICKPKESLHGV